MPSYCKDESIRDLITNLLVKRKSGRLSSFEKIKSHFFFENFNFEDLVTLNYLPRYIPSVSIEEPRGKSVSFSKYISVSKDFL